MFYITGDTHGNFLRIADFCSEFGSSLNLSKETDCLVVLGDAGINYYGQEKDSTLKETLSELPITIFSIHGNHEARPEAISTYEQKLWNGGLVYFEKRYPSILFGIDGEVYDFPCGKTLVCGGAYSVDKYYRLMRGFRWWDDEQPSDEIKAKVENVIAQHSGNFDIVLTHTAPLRFEPIEWFISGLDQRTVDKSTEEWLDKIYDMIECRKWFIGHYHGCKDFVDESTGTTLKFMFDDITELR